jgi:formylglycine-generating enzyme required for sulfatase activity
LIEPTGLSADCRLVESAEYIPDNYPLIDLGAGIRIEFARIRSGEFLMGTPSGFTGRDDDELAREVTISRSFLLSRGPVTQDQWERVMGGNSSWFRGGDLPVEQV